MKQKIKSILWILCLSMLFFFKLAQASTKLETLSKAKAVVEEKKRRQKSPEEQKAETNALDFRKAVRAFFAAISGKGESQHVEEDILIIQKTVEVVAQSLKKNQQDR